MSSESSKPLSKAKLRGPIQDFQTYCEIERERRRNSGEEFDEELFDEAVELVVRRLEMMEERGRA
ncbi:MAG TPA: hypothetical protein EYH03_06830 [Chromatiales bacterium]|nr:hypothetical protein [Chromatiales bacterium]